MRVLVIVLQDLAPNRLLKDERLTNLRQLMSAGCYGRLAQSTGVSSFDEEIVCERVAQSDGQVVRADCRHEALAPQAAHACSLVEDGAWGYLRVILGPCTEDPARNQAAGVEPLALDGVIGQVLERLDDQTAVLLLAGLASDLGKSDQADPACSVFVFAAPGYPALDELNGVAWSDLAPTVLDAAGYDLLPSLSGRSLVAGLKPGSGADDLSLEEEALLRARFEGLGYVG